MIQKFESLKNRLALGVPPHSGSKEALQWLMLGRLTVLYFVLAAVVLNRVFGVGAPGAVTAYFLLSMGFAFNCVMALTVESLSGSSIYKFGQIVFDSFLISLWISLSIAPDPLFILLYLIQVLGVSLTLFKRGGVYASLSCSVAFGVLIASGRVDGGVFTWLAYVGLFVAVGWIGGYLSEELHRTNERLAEKSRKMEELKERHKRIIEGLPTGLITVDKNMEVTFVNPAAEHILHRAAADLVGKNLFASEPQLAPFFSQVIAEDVEPPIPGEGKIASTHVSHHKAFFVQADPLTRLQQAVEFYEGNKKFIFRGDVADLTREGGKVLLFQDVTRLVNLEEQLKQNEKLAAVGQLAAGIAHEIRNPLASMSASIEMLKSNFPVEHRDEDQKLMDIALREIDRLNLLISDFLNFVKPEQFKRGTVEVARLLQECVTQLKNTRDFKTKIQLKENYDPAAIASGSPEKLKQVVLNLLVNAVQAMPKGGRIDVGCKVDGGSVVFWVQDEGTGMSEETLRHLYEPFFTTKESGTGLGLATAYKIVEAHEGRIRVESKVEHGSRFEISIPRHLG